MSHLNVSFYVKRHFEVFMCQFKVRTMHVFHASVGYSTSICCMYVYIYIHIYVYMNIYVYTFVYMCMYVYMNVHVCIYIYIYTYI